MSLRVVHGKPGSGKSCYVVSLIVKMLADWVRYEKDNDEPYPRILYTNIPLDIEALNAYLTVETGIQSDVAKYIRLIDAGFFVTERLEYKEWWEQFPEGAFIVIDEVHHFLPANLKNDKSGKDLAAEFMKYISMHRHQQHDLIFLTQHLNNITVEVKRMAEVVFEVLNIKNITVGRWPFLIQMQDIDVVREAWGCPVQLAHIKRGICTASSVDYDKNCEQFVLSPKLFGLYRSHTMSSEALDRPSLRLGKIGSVVWFARRYFMKFSMWAVALVTIFYCVKTVIAEIPNALQKGLVPASLAPVNPHRFLRRCRLFLRITFTERIVTTLPESQL